LPLKLSHYIGLAEKLKTDDSLLRYSALHLKILLFCDLLTISDFVGPCGVRHSCLPERQTISLAEAVAVQKGKCNIY